MKNFEEKLIHARIEEARKQRFIATGLAYYLKEQIKWYNTAKETKNESLIATITEWMYHTAKWCEEACTENDRLIKLVDPGHDAQPIRYDGIICEAFEDYNDLFEQEYDELDEPYEEEDNKDD